MTQFHKAGADDEDEEEGGTAQGFANAIPAGLFYLNTKFRPCRRRGFFVPKGGYEGMSMRGGYEEVEAHPK